MYMYKDMALNMCNEKIELLFQALKEACYIRLTRVAHPVWIGHSRHSSTCLGG